MNWLVLTTRLHYVIGEQAGEGVGTFPCHLGCWRVGRPISHTVSVDPIAVGYLMRAPILRWQTHVRLGPLVQREACRQRELETLQAGELIVKPLAIDDIVL